MKCSLAKVVIAAIMVAVLAGVVVGITLLVVNSSGKTVSFPETFKFGAASASYQIEGAWDADGKSPNVWDHLMHMQPNYTADSKNGDVAADSYNMWQKDLDALKDINFEVYRFSLSWSRILPDGAKVNMKGIEYYNKVINGLIAQGMEPLVTIFHWDLPQFIQDLGGWTNPQVADYFRVYADTVFYHFGDRVKRWITVNEPSVFCGEGYGYTTKAPAIASPGVGDYLCAHNVLLANAAAYHLYQEKYYNQQKGQVGICLNAGMSWPWNPNDPKDVEAAERSIQFDMGKFSHPIFSKTGGYPPVMIDLIEKKSEAEGRPWSRLPEMSYATQRYIRGTADFLALNYYSSGFASDRAENPDFAPSWWADMNTDGHRDESWVRAKSEWLYKVPEGLHDLLVWIKNSYGNPSVMITENGWSDDGELKDDGRVLYIREHLEALGRAVEEGCNVNAYTVWSLTDNFEWKMGYTERFGIHYIDFDSVDKTRVPKDSALFFKKFMADGKKFEF